jgi:thiol:disulfide interchange protein
MRTAINLLLPVAVMVIMAVPASAEVTSAPYHSTLDAARQAAGERPVLIDFYTDW